MHLPLQVDNSVLRLASARRKDCWSGRKTREWPETPAAAAPVVLAVRNDGPAASRWMRRLPGASASSGMGSDQTGERVGAATRAKAARLRTRAKPSPPRPVAGRTSPTIGDSVMSAERYGPSPCWPWHLLTASRRESRPGCTYCAAFAESGSCARSSRRPGHQLHVTTAQLSNLGPHRAHRKLVVITPTCRTGGASSQYTQRHLSASTRASPSRTGRRDQE